MSLKDLLTFLAIGIGIVSYISYFRDIFAGRTKPHTFTWLVWAVLTTIGFAGQLAGGGGAGVWVTGFTALVAFIIFGLALFRGEKEIARSDWLSLSGAVLALLLWFITKGPLLSVILITVIDALGFYPTFRKSYRKPGEETLSTYALSSIKFIFALFALDHFTVITALYPASLVVANAAFVVMLIIRRRA